MIEKINKKILFLLLIFITLILISAFLIEYRLDHKPCKLCIYQRIPYIASIVLIFLIFWFKRYEKLIFLLLTIIFVFSSILAFYHFGIEQGFFSETLLCDAGDSLKALSKEQLIEKLKQNTISCKTVNFKIMGLSLAAINTIFSLALSAIFLKLFIKKYEKN